MTVFSANGGDVVCCRGQRGIAARNISAVKESQLGYITTNSRQSSYRRQNGHPQSQQSRRSLGSRHVSHARLKQSEKKSAKPAKRTGKKVGSNGSRGGKDDEEVGLATKIGAPAGLLLGLVLLLGGGYAYKDQLRTFIDYFIKVAEEWGPLGYLAYGGVYTGLEVLAVPAVPLTMTAGIIFGTVPGVIVVSAASTTAATIAFLIARYAARDRILELAEKNNKFRAVDKAIGKNGFKVVTLLRLSPLLPLALSNYFYGLTSVDLASYVAGSWLGMLPGTVLYVIAGAYSRELIDNDESMGLPVNKWQVGLGIVVTLAILGYIGNLAKGALDEVEEEEAA